MSQHYLEIIIAIRQCVEFRNSATIHFSVFNFNYLPTLVNPDWTFDEEEFSLWWYI